MAKAARKKKGKKAKAKKKARKFGLKKKRAMARKAKAAPIFFCIATTGRCCAS